MEHESITKYLIDNLPVLMSSFFFNLSTFVVAVIGAWKVYQIALRAEKQSIANSEKLDATSEKLEEAKIQKQVIATKIDTVQSTVENKNAERDKSIADTAKETTAATLAASTASTAIVLTYSDRIVQLERELAELKSQKLVPPE